MNINSNADRFTIMNAKYFITLKLTNFQLFRLLINYSENIYLKSLFYLNKKKSLMNESLDCKGLLTFLLKENVLSFLKQNS